MATQERVIIESMFQIVDKDGRDVPFLLNPAQARLDTNLTGRDIIPKARQLGISAYFLARYTAKCLSKRNTRAVVISHDKESTQRMLARVHYYLANLRGPKAVIKNASKNELTFPKTNSMFYIGTAGSRKFGRGDMITDLHCSEVAYWEDPKSLISGLFQAVPRETGEIAIESTGNGVGNYYHRQCMRAYEGKSRFRCHFFDWLKAPEYSIALSDTEKAKILASLDEGLDEPKLYNAGVTLEQIAFRREKLDELDMDFRLFKQEYPLSLDECFQSTGYSFFSVIPYDPTDQWIRLTDFDRNLYVYEPAWKHHDSRYALGVDVSGGVKRNRSVIEIIDIHRWEQVGEWISDSTAPDLLAKKVIQLGRHFNDAFVTVETNNHGAVTLLKLIEGFPKDNIKGYPAHLVYQNNKGGDTLLDYGYKTTQRTKPIIIGNLRKDLLEGYKVRSPVLKNELDTFVEDENEKLCAAEGCFDDTVMAKAVGLEGARDCIYVYEKRNLENRKIQAKDPFNLESALDELRKRSRNQVGDFPIPYQDIDSGNLVRH